MNTRYAEKIIHHVMEHHVIEPEIKLKGDYIELIWCYNGNTVKAHIDCLDHMNYIICSNGYYKELDKNILLENLKELYGIPE